MPIDDKEIQDILVREHYITAEDISEAEKIATANKTSIVGHLLSVGLVTKDLIGQAVAESFKISYADLNSHQPTREQVLKIPEETAKKFRIVVFAENTKNVTIATDTPNAEGLVNQLKELFPKKKIVIAYSLSEDIDITFSYYRKSLETRFSKVIKEQKHIAPEIINQIISDALSFNASDIHFEPHENDVVVRFRVDGVMQEAGRLPREFYENILNRVKVQSSLRIDEHQATQDGSMRYEKDGTIADLRTSIVPTIAGEKVVLRVLAAYVQGFSLVDLGLSDVHQNLLKNASNKPFGMTLVVGPTGSGKTTTLYALIKIANSPDVNITTIEDPVEYRVAGINQIQVNTQTNLTFAKGLRSIVRQDPDIILVGEIRDQETAEIAVNAALTGHLLYSTFHANDAATAIPRLLTMGIEPFLLASTLELVVAQRLVRKVCEHCKYSVTKTARNFKGSALANIRPFFTGKSITLYEGKKCNACSFTGYKGRTAIFECIANSPAMQDLIMRNPSSKEIWELAQREGARTLYEDGIEKVMSGVTTFDELLRVAEPPEKEQK